MANITIRQLTADDIDMLRQMSIDTFIDTYEKYNSPENMQLYVQQHFTRQQLLHELTAKENYFFAAFTNDAPVGYVKMRTSEDPEALEGKKHIELERIYAVKNYQGRGLGYKMMQHCLELATAKGFDVLWLGVWEQNEKALQFYKKCGFEIFGDHVFMLGSEKQTDYLMKKELHFV